MRHPRKWEELPPEEFPEEMARAPIAYWSCGPAQRAPGPLCHSEPSEESPGARFPRCANARAGRPRERWATTEIPRCARTDTLTGGGGPSAWWKRPLHRSSRRRPPRAWHAPRTRRPSGARGSLTPQPKRPPSMPGSFFRSQRPAGPATRTLPRASVCARSVPELTSDSQGTPDRGAEPAPYAVISGQWSVD